MLTPFLLTATLFRVIESIQQFDIIYAMTQGGPGDRLTVFQVEAYLNFFQSTNVGRFGCTLNDPLGDHLFPVEHLHQELAPTARKSARRRIEEYP